MTPSRMPILKWMPVLLAAPGALALGSATATHDAEAATAPKTTAVLRIYLARHGQTDWNAQRRLQGHTDTHLDSTGRAQAKGLAAQLTGIRFDHVYCSTLSRSRETAEILHGSAPIDSLPGLMEIGLGKFEGLYLGGPDTATIAEYRRRTADPEDTLDGGESETQHLARVRKTLDMIRAKHPSGNVLIVGHGGTNKLVLRALLDLTREQTADINQNNDELYLIEFVPGAPTKLWKLIPKERLKEL
jgi:2,3-bisphosphoglycerate-dependent phosphoglycerate mutase